MTEPAILAIDQGTTSSRAIVFDQTQRAVAIAQLEFPQLYPANGWVEHDAEAIWDTTLKTCTQAISQAQAKGYKVAAAGLTNQRETALVWDRETGATIYNAIVWQDRRTADRCLTLKKNGCEPDIQARTGLLLDPYFSAAKIAWILDHVEGARARAEAGALAFGTVDTFLLSRLTGGRTHATDATNASRTSLFNIHDGDWDDALLEMFRIPRALLPEVRDSNADYGQTDRALFGQAIPILGVAGDQQAATIGQACFAPGDIKSTYGTGCFAMLNTGETALASQNRLLTTIAYQLDGKRTYALEGSIFIAGAGVQWLRDGLKVIDDAAQTEAMARSLASNDGVYLVPAFTGLGAPYWAPQARGAIFGLTRASTPETLARAMVEAVCYQTHDLITAMANDGARPAALRVDGGMAANDWMCGFLSGLLDMPVDRPQTMETTALGAAFLAGLGAGLYDGLDDIKGQWRREQRFKETMSDTSRSDLIAGWTRAVRAALDFAQESETDI